MSLQAIVFDLGGVVLDSPLSFISDFERRHGLEPTLIARLVGGYSSKEGPWQQLERGEMPLAEFCKVFDEDIRAAGYSVSTLTMMTEMSGHTVVRPEMLEAIRRLRTAGLKVGALTNNWRTDDIHEERLQQLRDEFDVFVESCRVGMRKPELKIYEHTEQVLGEEGAAIVFLDDIGHNLKIARGRGWDTIKVADPRRALEELEARTGLSLVSGRN